MFRFRFASCNKKRFSVEFLCSASVFSGGNLKSSEIQIAAKRKIQPSHKKQVGKFQLVYH